MRSQFWHHFLSLEDDLDVISQYIEIDKRNYGVFSIKLLKLYLASGSELDIMFKQMIKKYTLKDGESIIKYRKSILQRFPSFYKTSVYVYGTDIAIKPYECWEKSHELAWWQMYQKVKHDRGVFFERANLENVLNCMAGLMIVNMYFHYDKQERHPGITPNKIFYFPGMPQGITTAGSYTLPDFS